MENKKIIQVVITYFQSRKPDRRTDSRQNHVTGYFSQDIANGIGSCHIVQLVSKHIQVFLPLTIKLKSLNIKLCREETHIPDTKALTRLAASRNLMKNPMSIISHVEQSARVAGQRRDLEVRTQAAKSEQCQV
jgi:hypothetical protein